MPQGRPRGATARPPGVQAQALPEPARQMAARRGGLLAQLPGQYSRGRRPGAPDPRAPARHPGVRRRPFGQLHRARDPGARRRRHRLRDQGRGRGGRLPDPGRLGGEAGARHAARRGHDHGRGPAAAHDRIARRHAARARPCQKAPQVLHRRARSLRLGRVLARLPVGLHLLQRLDLLRPQLPQGERRGGRRGPGAGPRVRRVHRR